MKQKVPTYMLERIEKAIKEKYGDEAIADPRQYWNEEKEKKYQEQIAEQKKIEKKVEKIEKNGFFEKMFLFKEENSGCCICEGNLFSFRDKVYINKYDVCYECYIQYVEGREEKFLKPKHK